MDTRTRPARRTSQPKARLKPSQMRRKKLKRRETRRRLKRKKSLRPTALRRRQERRLRQSPRHPKRRRRHLPRVLGRALASLVAPSVALLRRLRRRKLQRRRPRVGRSDPSSLITPTPAIQPYATALFSRIHVRVSMYSFLTARHSSLWT